ncbi:hypothetical protein NDU88_008086 [Pleurodeles waltl]|uniref:Uncharacterized protein n=1 Tax=Pleurodeles waltl TaxID=8319 RepID=A0AAV7RS53_PLEWA|nr:hypothetical protein NDU88_008086 [Pleurodeles waltl]
MEQLWLSDWLWVEAVAAAAERDKVDSCDRLSPTSRYSEASCRGAGAAWALPGSRGSESGARGCRNSAGREAIPGTGPRPGEEASDAPGRDTDSRAGTAEAAEIAGRGAFPPGAPGGSRGCLGPRERRAEPGPRDSAAGAPESGREPGTRRTECPKPGITGRRPRWCHPEERRQERSSPWGWSPRGLEETWLSAAAGPTGRRPRNEVLTCPEALPDQRLDYRAPGPCSPGNNERLQREAETRE